MPVTCEQKHLTMVVVRDIMAMAMHRQVDVFRQVMGMPMILDHLLMILKSLEEHGRMAERRHHGPEPNQQAQDRGDDTSSVASQSIHWIALLDSAVFGFPETIALLSIANKQS